MKFWNSRKSTFSHFEKITLFQSNIKTILTPSVCNYNPQCIFTIHWGKHLSLAGKLSTANEHKSSFTADRNHLGLYIFPSASMSPRKATSEWARSVLLTLSRWFPFWGLVAAYRQWQLTGSQSGACLQNTSTDEAWGQLKDFAELVMVISRTCPGWNFIFTYGTACY